MKLIKNIQVYAPEDLGVKDVLISDSKIEKIDDHITYPYSIETGFSGEFKQLMGQVVSLHQVLLIVMYILLVVGEKQALFLVLDLLKHMKY